LGHTSSAIKLRINVCSP